MYCIMVEIYEKDIQPLCYLDVTEKHEIIVDSMYSFIFESTSNDYNTYNKELCMISKVMGTQLRVSPQLLKISHPFMCL